MMTETLALQKGIKPLVKIIGTAEIGLNPQVMGLGPVDAITALVCSCLLFMINFMLTYQILVYCKND